MLATALKGLAIGIWALMVDYFFVGWLSHGYQRLTPGVWRVETSKNYAGATAAHMVWGIAMALAYRAWGMPALVHNALSAAWIGLSLWALVALPILVSIGIFVNWHTVVWLGLLADWLVILCGATLIAFWLL